MDPQIKSVMTSVLMTLATGAATWAVGEGIIPDADKLSFSNEFAEGALALITVALGWYKVHAASQKSLIQEVNKAENGVKVVPVSSPTMAVNEPIKGVGK